MTYQIRRVFCATALGMDRERAVFHDLLAEINRTQAMQRDVLLAPVSLVPQMADKRFFQAAINSNIRESSFYIQVFDGSWGPPERNFEADYALALACAEDPALPMRGVALACPGAEFSQELKEILTQALDAILACESTAARPGAASV